jgi:hypothetical protein
MDVSGFFTSPPLYFRKKSLRQALITKQGVENFMTNYIQVNSRSDWEESTSGTPVKLSGNSFVQNAPLGLYTETLLAWRVLCLRQWIYRFGRVFRLPIVRTFASESVFGTYAQDNQLKYLLEHFIFRCFAKPFWVLSTVLQWHIKVG